MNETIILYINTKKERIIETHNGLSAIIANNVKEIYRDEILEFDGFWVSSFTDSAAKGYPDIEIIGMESRYETIRQILNNTNTLNPYD